MFDFSSNSTCPTEQDKKLLALVTGNKILVVSDLRFQKIVMKMWCRKPDKQNTKICGLCIKVYL